jgi:hypothetical protein
MSSKVFEEKMFVSYKDMNGQIMFIDKQYMTFTPFNSKALLVIYKEDWGDVTVL